VWNRFLDPHSNKICGCSSPLYKIQHLHITSAYPTYTLNRVWEAPVLGEGQRADSLTTEAQGPVFPFPIAGDDRHVTTHPVFFHWDEVSQAFFAWVSLNHHPQEFSL
jgi:hypothetical protein